MKDKTKTTLKTIKDSAYYLIINYPVAVVLLLIVIIVSFFADNYFTTENFLNVFRQISVIGILACGMTFVIIAGGIDLSVGAIISFAGALIINAAKTVSTIPGIFITIAAGIIIGAISGFILSKIKGKLGESFMITYGMQTVVAAITLIYTGGIYQKGIKELLFVSIGRGISPIIIFISITAIMQFLLTKTRFGRNIYFLGGNVNVARLSGINIGFYRIAVFALNGALAAIAAIVLTSRVGTASPTAGIGYELDAIAAAVVGGVSMAGGQGNILNTLLGVIIMGVLGNALNMLNISSYPQMIMKGIIIIAAVSLDAINKRKGAAV
jgi:ribose/xylose/arabinose/galactoside ABC-type transport system permease subunit